MFSAHKLFGDLPAKNDFLEKISISLQEDQALRLARKSIRNHLRETFRDLARHIQPTQLFENQSVTAARKLADGLKPLFFTQGSYAYKTLNAPAQTGQQMDLDDGMYVPISLLSNSRPSLASAGLFALVDGSLTGLAKQKGWKVLTHKATCVRVEMNARMHIDVPLYAIPDDQVRLLEEAAAKQGIHVNANDAAFRESLDQPSSWALLPHDAVLLAHRTDGWKKSDPRLLHDWFRREVEIHGPQLRHVVRYIKAWRDATWPSSKLSSVLLMACVCEIFSENRTLSSRRDDLAVLIVARALPNKLLGRVENPTDRSEDLARDLSVTERQSAIEMIQRLAADLDSGLNQAVDRDYAIRHLRSGMGERFPNLPNMLERLGAAAEVERHPARIAAVPLVGRSISG